MKHSVKTKKPKILILDIETSPFLMYAWTPYNIEKPIVILEPTRILSFAAKWSDGNEVIVKGLPDYSLYRKDKKSDYAISNDLLVNYLSKADAVLAHNGGSFDFPRIKRRLFDNGLPQPPPTLIYLDTKAEAARNFGSGMNSLEELCKARNIGEKIKHNGKDLWLDCMDGDMDAWKLMKKYNKHDVVLLSGLYNEMKPLMKGLNHGIFTDNATLCGHCGSPNIQSRGTKPTKTGRYPTFWCKDCDGWSSGSVKIKRNKDAPILIKPE